MNIKQIIHEELEDAFARVVSRIVEDRDCFSQRGWASFIDDAQSGNPHALKALPHVGRVSDELTEADEAFARMRETLFTSQVNGTLKSAS